MERVWPLRPKSEVTVWKVLSSYIIIHASVQLQLMSQTDDDPPRSALLIIA